MRYIFFFFLALSIATSVVAQEEIVQDAQTKDRFGDIKETIQEKSRTWGKAISVWRLKKLAQYEVQKTERKALIDEAGSSERIDKLAQPEPVEDEVLPKAVLPTPASPMTYLSYLWYSALVFVFSTPLTFYITAGLLLFLVLRFFYTRMV